jgi:hypothetical protein
LLQVPTWAIWWVRLPEGGSVGERGCNIVELVVLYPRASRPFW